MWDVSVVKPYAVVVVLEQDGEIVVCSYPKAPRYFVLPGGKVEEVETPYQAAVRELYEETGIFASIAAEPFYRGESHNGKPMWAYAASVSERLLPTWYGPEGPCRLSTFAEARAGYNPDFLMAYDRVMEAYHDAMDGDISRLAETCAKMRWGR